jgi:hypothetical protein
MSYGVVGKKVFVSQVTGWVETNLFISPTRQHAHATVSRPCLRTRALIRCPWSESASPGAYRVWNSTAGEPSGVEVTGPARAGQCRLVRPQRPTNVQPPESEKRGKRKETMFSPAWGLRTTDGSGHFSVS